MVWGLVLSDLTDDLADRILDPCSRLIATPEVFKIHVNDDREGSRLGVWVPFQFFLLLFKPSQKWNRDDRAIKRLGSKRRLTRIALFELTRQGFIFWLRLVCLFSRLRRRGANLGRNSLRFA